MANLRVDNLEGLLSPFLRRERFKAAMPYVRGDVLDYGCGVGLLSELVTPGRYVGVDIDRDILTVARHRYPGVRFFEHEQLDSLGEERFDTVVALAVIEHLPHPSAILRKFKQMLQNNGRIVLTTPNPLLDWAHGLGGRVGLFSGESHDEHQSLMNRVQLSASAEAAGLRMTVYKRFLWGANQLAILER
ncbi:MAG: methyltransferase domain-containing protein [Rhodospirillales bacterium]|nr:MAG: methyltransferase domain-containing protein [Rhodospirillales bacterium]